MKLKEMIRPNHETPLIAGLLIFGIAWHRFDAEVATILILAMVLLLWCLDGVIDAIHLEMNRLHEVIDSDEPSLRAPLPDTLTEITLWSTDTSAKLQGSLAIVENPIRLRMDATAGRPWIIKFKQSLVPNVITIEFITARKLETSQIASMVETLQQYMPVGYHHTSTWRTTGPDVSPYASSVNGRPS